MVSWWQRLCHCEHTLQAADSSWRQCCTGSPPPHPTPPSTHAHPHPYTSDCVPLPLANPGCTGAMLVTSMSSCSHLSYVHTRANFVSVAYLYASPTQCWHRWLSFLVTSIVPFFFWHLKVLCSMFLFLCRCCVAFLWIVISHS